MTQLKDKVAPAWFKSLYTMWDFERMIEDRMIRARQKKEMIERGDRAIVHKPRRVRGSKGGME